MRRWTKRGTIAGVGGGVSSGVSNFISRVRVNITQNVVGDFGRFSQAVGFSVLESPKRLTTPQQVGVFLNQLVSGEVNRAQQTIGLVVQQKNEGSTTPPVSVGAEILQWVVNLVQTTYAVVATSNGSWTNPNNSVGSNNGIFATNANTTFAAASGTISHTFASQNNKTELTIDSVELSLFWRYAAGAVGPGTYRAEYSFDNVNWTTISTGTTSFDSSTIPMSLSLTTLVGQDWAKLSNFRTRFTHTAAAGLIPSTLSIDAIRLTVNASRIDTL